MKTKQLNKVRNMKGSRPGGGSAGRANGSHVEKRLTADGPGRFTGFGDVGRACDRWLMEHDPVWRKMREKRVEDDFLRHGRRLAEADKAERESRVSADFLERNRVVFAHEISQDEGGEE